MSKFDYTGLRGTDFPYTDLACERRRADASVRGVEYRREESEGGAWERIRITSPEGAASIGRPMGTYDTLCLLRMDLLDGEAIDNAREEIARELCSIFDNGKIFPGRLLVAGLGNPRLTPDEVGSLAAGKVRPTLHIMESDPRLFASLECSEIAVTVPGVAATSGLDAAVVIGGICDRIRPDAVIVIDALASRASERLGTTVQITDTGILPGSGLGNGKRPLNKETVGVPVIAIGVPTVIDSRMFWIDAQAESRSIGDARKARQTMFVSPKEINEIAETAAEIIGGGINQAFGIFCQG